MFDIQKYETIKQLYKLMSYVDLITVFCAFGFVYSILVSSGFFMMYLILLACSVCLKFWLKSRLKEVENV